MVKLVAIDMDGTLLNSKNEISDENKNALLKAIQKGIHVVIATGRIYADAMKLLHEAGLSVPVINLNGSQIHTVTGELLHAVPLERHLVQEIHQIAKDEQVFSVLFTDQGVFPCSDTYPLLLEEFRRGVFEGFVTQESLAQRINHIGMQIERGEHINQYFQDPDIRFLKFVLSSYHLHKLEQVRHRLQTIDQLAITSSFRTNIEINHRDGEKGKALAMMAEYLGVPMEQTMAIGDNWNDLSMFRAAGISVAMGNTEDEVAKNCDYITKINDEHGVAYAFEQWVL